MFESRHRKSNRFLSSQNCLSFTIILFALMTVFSLTAPYVFATEGGGSIYSGGNEDFMAGALPPPGFYLINFFNYSDYDSTRDNSGHKAGDFHGQVVANAFRFVYVSKKKLLGADVCAQAILPLANVHATLELPNGARMSQTKTGLGDITVNPFFLAWHWKNLHAAAGVDLNLPTGAYNEEDFVNIGRHYWNFQPLVAFTYLSDTGFEASAKIMYNFNTVNSATHYTSGQELGIDYLVGQHCGPWAFGVNGYYYLQTTDDEYRGHKVGKYFPKPGFEGWGKGTLLSVGPAVQYNYKNTFFSLKYQWDTSVKNKPEGSHLWLKFMYAF